MQYVHLNQLAPLSDTGIRRELTSAVLFVPSRCVSSFEIDCSKIPSRHLAKAIPNLVEEFLAEPLINVDIVYKLDADKIAHIFVCSKARIADWLELAASNGFAIQAIYPDFYLLPCSTMNANMHCEGDYCIARINFYSGFSGPKSLTEQVLSHGGFEVEILQTELFDNGMLLKTQDWQDLLSGAISLVQPVKNSSVMLARIFKPLSWGLVAYLVLVFVLLGWGNYYSKLGDSIKPSLVNAYEKLTGMRVQTPEKLEQLKQRLASKIDSEEQFDVIALLRFIEEFDKTQAVELTELNLIGNKLSLSYDKEPSIDALKSHPMVEKIDSSKVVDKYILTMTLSEEVR